MIRTVIVCVVMLLGACEMTEGDANVRSIEQSVAVERVSFVGPASARPTTPWSAYYNGLEIQIGGSVTVVWPVQLPTGCSIMSWSMSLRTTGQYTYNAYLRSVLRGEETQIGPAEYHTASDGTGLIEIGAPAADPVEGGRDLAVVLVAAGGSSVVDKVYGLSVTHSCEVISGS